MWGRGVEGFSSFEVSGSSGGIHSYHCVEKAGFQKHSPHLPVVLVHGKEDTHCLVGRCCNVLLAFASLKSTWQAGPWPQRQLPVLPVPGRGRNGALGVRAGPRVAPVSPMKSNNRCTAL